jgi:SAM-dependent methyltransferase
LTLLLASHGFEVQSYEGNERRSSTAAWLVSEFIKRYPYLSNRVQIVSGYFPEAVALPLDSKAVKRVAVATNITCTYTATNHEAIFDALLEGDFSEVIIDLARFGINRDAQRDRDALRHQLAERGFGPVEVVHLGNPYEYWLFEVPQRSAQETPGQATTAVRPVLAARPSVEAVAVTPRQIEPSVPKGAPPAVFPLSSPSGGTLFSIYGDRLSDNCPVCRARNSVALWRMPMANLKEPISLFGGYFNQVPTLQVPATVYCFDFCRQCESIYLNPTPQSQKEQYRKTDHYIRTMQAETLWKQYENAFNGFAKWIPEGADVLMDAACGVGPYLEVARRREPGRWRRLIGLELSERYVEHMRASGLEAYAFDIDTDDLVKLVGPDSVDFIAFCEAFEHVERPLDALAKLLSVLKSGGRLYFTAQRYGRDVQAAVRPGEPIYIGEKVMKELPQRLGCKLLDVTTSSMRYYAVLEK